MDEHAPFDESLVTPRPRNVDPLKLDGSVGITFIDREYRLRREAVMRDTSSSSKKPGERSCTRYLPTLLPFPNLDDYRLDRRSRQIAAHSSYFEMLFREDSKANGESPTSSTPTSLLESLFFTSTEDDSQRQYLALESSLPPCTLLPRKRPWYPTDGHSEESERPLAPSKRHDE